MRDMMRDQLPLMQAFIEHEHAQELAGMSEALEQCADVLELVERDLLQGRDPLLGRPGLSAEQVIRALVVRQLNDFSYEELSFHLADSTCYRRFCRLGNLEKPPSKSTLQENIKSLSAETLEALNRRLLGWAKTIGVEKGEIVRGDCTTVESTIHAPTDSWLLWDTVRVGVHPALPLGTKTVRSQAASRGDIVSKPKIRAGFAALLPRKWFSGWELS